MKVEINKEMKLSEHFTLGELCKTSYHTLDGNIPSHVAIENLKNICENWLEDLRYSYNTLYGTARPPLTPPVGGGIQSKVSPVGGGTAALPLKGDNPQSLPLQGNNPQSLPLQGEMEGVTDIPVVITSGYRSEEVNRLCGGATGSNHLTGCAVDIRCMGPEHQIRMANNLLDIADGTKRDFDELILEKRGTTRWIHFAVRPPSQQNRRKILFDMR